MNILSSPPQDGVYLQISDSKVTGAVLTATDIKKKTQCSVRALTQHSVRLIMHCRTRQKITVH
jgi:hypothetical protein